jgi:hypothetical protein
MRVGQQIFSPKLNSAYSANSANLSLPQFQIPSMSDYDWEFLQTVTDASQKRFNNPNTNFVVDFLERYWIHTLCVVGVLLTSFLGFAYAGKKLMIRSGLRESLEVANLARFYDKEIAERQLKPFYHPDWALSYFGIGWKSFIEAVSGNDRTLAGRILDDYLTAVHTSRMVQRAGGDEKKFTKLISQLVTAVNDEA